MQIDNRHPAIEKWHVIYALKSVDVHGFVLNPFKNWEQLGYTDLLYSGTCHKVRYIVVWGE